MINTLTVHCGEFKDEGHIDYECGNGAHKKGKVVKKNFFGFVSSHFDVDQFGDPRSVINIVSNDNSFRIDLFRNDKLYSPMQLSKFVAKLARLIHFQTKYDVYLDIIQGQGCNYWINMSAKKVGQAAEFSPLADYAIFVERAYVKNETK